MRGGAHGFYSAYALFDYFDLTRKAKQLAFFGKTNCPVRQCLK